MKAKILVSALVGVVALGALGVNASTNYTLLGDAHVVAGGNPGNAAQLSSTGTARAVVQLTSTSVATVADITNLGADHNFTVGDVASGLLSSRS